jgi:hypothetical protein
MGINKYDIAEKVGPEGSTKDRLAAVFGVDATSKGFVKAFDNAAGHGLIATESDETDSDALWTQTDKGKEKVAGNRSE